ncbi:cutinase-domain-containing protein [Mollisia scopiformis]|uniref:cutinase n=1 Tax=Mollisia scopiformis TaxID=149040 RepID=A0A132BCV4_MOLSC|nr:cutinase-domain-containing protein [Mollisia scopiformis]KUJ10260.1 cutinase-domain-containing protein [Mollisia scopiformis]
MHRLLVLFHLISFVSAGILDDIGSSLGSLLGNNTASVLGTFLGDHGTVIFQNGLLKNTTACPAMSVIFARGTAEPGNVGILTGPPFFAAIAEYMNGTNQLAIQGVDYPADVPGFLAGGSTQGANTMAKLVNKTLASCPNTQLLLSGYSQGAQVVHLATASLPSNTTSKISSVVLFGDPKNGTAVSGVDASKVMTFCNPGDDICQGGDLITLSHLNYSLDAGSAAMFALGTSGAKLGITSQRLRPAAGGLGG